MKKTLVTIACSMLALSIVQAETFVGTTDLSDKTFEELVILGVAKLSNVKAGSLDVVGALSFNNLEVTGDVEILGPIKEDSENLKCKDLEVVGTITAKNIMCSRINVKGSINVTNIKASGEAAIMGGVEIKNGELGNLVLFSDEITLENVKANSIVIEKTGILSQQNQTLHLKGDTVISGTIDFKSGKGTIVMGSGARIDGKINGGTVQKGKDTN